MNEGPKGNEGVSGADRYLDTAFRAEGVAGAKALREEHLECVSGRARCSDCGGMRK